ncbi:MAG: hypothetical protein WBO10_09145 [Pyrinomonadaceae bacterium]
MDVRELVNRRTRRTTLTLEADVAEYVEEKLAGNRKLKEKNVINDLLRKGIRSDAQNEVISFRIKPFKTTLVPGITTERLEEMVREI